MTYTNFRAWADEPASLEPELSVVIPAYNERDRILPTLASIVSELSAVAHDFEIIVSDDGSTDGTCDVVRGLGLRNVVVLDPGVNRGKGAAVRAGVRASRGRLVLFSDADMSTPIHELWALRAAIDDGADVAIGSRAAEGASEEDRSRLRRILSWGWRRVTRLGLGLDVADTQCGFKLFRREAARVLFAAGRLDGFSFDAELLFLARRYGYQLREVPIQWYDAPGSKVRPGRVALQFARDVVGIRRRALTGAYPSSPDQVRDRGLRVAVVTAVPPSTATLTEYGHHLVQHLAAKPEIDDLVVLAEDGAGVPDDVEGVAYHGAWRFDSPITPLRLLRAVRRHRPDVVLFNAHFTSFGGRKVPAALGLLSPALIRALTPTKSAVLLHNVVDTVDLDGAGYGSNPIVNRVLIAIGRLLTRAVLCADTVVTTMPAYVDVLRDRYGADNVFLTPHGSFDDPGRAAAEPTEGPHRILAFGKFGTYKRVDELIEAHRLLLARGYDVECIVAGTDSPNAPGYLAALETEHRDVPALRFTGYVEEDDVPGLFVGASVVAFPYTATTGSSGPLHQAGTYARAVVAPRIGDFIDLIETEGFAAEAFEPGDPESLAAAITAILDDPDRRREMGERNFAAACSLPLAHVADWHVAHLENLAAA